MEKTRYTVRVLTDGSFELRVTNPSVPGVIVGPDHRLHSQICSTRVWQEIKDHISHDGMFEIEL